MGGLYTTKEMIDMMWPNMMWGFSGGSYSIIGMILSFIFTILIIAGIIILIVWLVKRTNAPDTSRTDGNALEILKKRYVKGEITKKEFDEMKKDIS